MPIETLRFTDAGPFEEIGFDFDPHVNVFTGPNTTGKSTALWVLGELLVYPFTMPSRMLRSDHASWAIEYRSSNKSETIEGSFPVQSSAMLGAYAELGYTCFIPAQRQSSNFRSSGPTVSENIESLAEQEIAALSQSIPEFFRELDRPTFLQWYRASRLSDVPELAKRRSLMLTGASITTDKAVIQKIVDLDYEKHRVNRPEIGHVIDQIVSIASEVTEGFPISLARVDKDEAGLFPTIKTPCGELPLDRLSQGTQSVIHCIARFLLGYAEYYDFPKTLENEPAILIIDEIDAHLHPSWQRQIIPTLTKRFQNLQIFCSTHSPLMLAGLERGQAQLLSRNEQGTIEVSTNETDIVGWTSDEILRNILDVRHPTDAETVRRANRLDELDSIKELSDEQKAEADALRQVVSLDLRRGPGSAIVAQFTEELRRASREGSPETDRPENN